MRESLKTTTKKKTLVNPKGGRKGRGEKGIKNDWTDSKMIGVNLTISIFTLNISSMITPKRQRWDKNSKTQIYAAWKKCALFIKAQVG